MELYEGSINDDGSPSNAPVTLKTSERLSKLAEEAIETQFTHGKERLQTLNRFGKVKTMDIKTANPADIDKAVNDLANKDGIQSVADINNIIIVNINIFTVERSYFYCKFFVWKLCDCLPVTCHRFNHICCFIKSCKGTFFAIRNLNTGFKLFFES